MKLESGSQDNLLAGVRAVDNGAGGVQLNDATHNWLLDVVAAHNGDYGVALFDSANNRFDRLTSAGNGNVGLSLVGSVGNAFNQILAVQSPYGLTLQAASNDNLFANVTASNNTTIGVSLDDSHGCVLANAVAANNDLGIALVDAHHATIVNAATGGCGTGVWLVRADASFFTGSLLFGGNTEDCFVSAGVEPGLDDGCLPAGRSDFTAGLDLDVLGGLVGKVTSDDPSSPHDDAGSAPFAVITDWTTLASPLRAWGPDGSTFPGNDHRGPCTAASVDCRIWDWRLADGGDLLRDVLPLPDDSQANDFVVEHVRSDGLTSEPFLRNAVEVHGTGGDDDGLCELGETCVHDRHLGAWQGGGNPVSSHSFDPADGPITGVTLREQPEPEHPVRPLAQPGPGQRAACGHLRPPRRLRSQTPVRADLASAIRETVRSRGRCPYRPARARPLADVDDPDPDLDAWTAGHGPALKSALPCLARADVPARPPRSRTAAGDETPLDFVVLPEQARHVAGAE
jgi:parallel beta-helix repeat protein